ncbi:MAG: 4a-hydroxytetrahydrobiopterin dehydratase [Patescibacteria group bacterium]|nr:4a-hydroxytetrahydrobiopterin dehydratase [Patescibacteria group bacterium]
MEEIRILSKSEIKDAMHGLPGWTFADDALIKMFKFNDFVASVNYLNKLLPFFEEFQHHPNIHIFYNRISFDLTSHDYGNKVTNLDTFIAKGIEKEYKQFMK